MRTVQRCSAVQAILVLVWISFTLQVKGNSGTPENDGDSTGVETSHENDALATQPEFGVAENVTASALVALLKNESLRNTSGIVVAFFSTRCPYSRAVVPLFVSLASDYPTLRFLYADALREMQMATRYGVNGYPTLIYFRRGKERTRSVGPHTLPDLRQFLENSTGTKARGVELNEVSEVVTLFQAQDGAFDHWLFVASVANIVLAVFLFP